MKIYNWQKDLNVGLMGTYILTKTFVDHMKKKKVEALLTLDQT